jgi:transposase
MGCVNQPPSDRRLELAVDMRRRGSTWEAVGERLNCSVETVRKWPHYYPERWHAAVRRAHDKMARAAEAELAQVLRMMLRDENNTTRWRAARGLLELRLRERRRDLDRAVPRRRSIQSKIRLILGILDDCSPKEVEKAAEACRHFARIWSEKPANTGQK